MPPATIVPKVSSQPVAVTATADGGWALPGERLGRAARDQRFSSATARARPLTLNLR
jgi:hypothetical protein